MAESKRFTRCPVHPRLPVYRPLLLLIFLWGPAFSQAQDVVSRRDSLILNRADSLLRVQETSRALGLYREILSRVPESYRARYGMARAYLHQGEPDRALPYLNDLTGTHPTEADPHVIRGFASLQQGRYEAAEADFRWVTDRFPEYADAWRGLGVALERSRELRRALDVYSRWIFVAPNDPDARLARARLYTELARRQEAREDLRVAVELGASPDAVDRIRRGIELDRWRDELSISAEYGYETFFGERDPWRKASVRASYEIQSRGALALEYIRADRFGETDAAFRPDLHVNLWRRASANVSWQRSPGSNFLARSDLYVELFQAIPDGWVPSLFYRRMKFPDLNADFFGVGMQKYTRNWYTRFRFAVVDVQHRTYPVLMGQVRYYFPGNEAHVTAYAGYGQEAMAVGLGPDVVTTSAFSAALYLQGYFTRHLGLTLGVNAEYTDVLPARFGLTAGLITRF